MSSGPKNSKESKKQGSEKNVSDLNSINLDLEKFHKGASLSAHQIIGTIAKIYRIYQSLPTNQQHLVKKNINQKIARIDLGQYFHTQDPLSKETLKSFPNFLRQHQELGLRMSPSLLDKTIELIKDKATAWSAPKIAQILKVLTNQKISYKILGITIGEYLENNFDSLKSLSIEDLKVFAKCLDNCGHFNLKAFQNLARAATEKINIISENSPLEDYVKLQVYFAKAKFKDPKYSEALAKQIKHNTNPITLNDLTDTLWSFAILNTKDLALLQTISSKIITHIESNPKKIWNQVISNASWCLTILDEDLAKIFLVETLPYLKTGPNSPFGDLQLHQSLVALGLRKDPFPSRISYEEQERQICKTNGFEQDVYDSLQRVLKIQQQKSKHTMLGKIKRHQNIDGVVIDFEVEIFSPKMKIIVECDGVPYHYINRNVAGGLVGNDILQDKIFAARGFGVIHINSQEWFAETRGENKNKDNLVRSRLTATIKANKD